MKPPGAFGVQEKSIKESTYAMKLMNSQRQGNVESECPKMIR